MITWGKIIDAITAWLFRRMETKPDDTGAVEGGDERTEFRLTMWRGKSKSTTRI